MPRRFGLDGIAECRPVRRCRKRVINLKKFNLGERPRTLKLYRFILRCAKRFDRPCLASIMTREDDVRLGCARCLRRGSVRCRLRRIRRGLRTEVTERELCSGRGRDLRPLRLGRLLRPPARRMQLGQAFAARRAADENDLGDPQQGQQIRQRRDRARSPISIIGEPSSTIGITRSTARATARSTPCSSANSSSSRDFPGRRC